MYSCVHYGKNLVVFNPTVNRERRRRRRRRKEEEEEEEEEEEAAVSCEIRFSHFAINGLL